jgi:hypothetical protein
MYIKYIPVLLRYPYEAVPYALLEYKKYPDIQPRDMLNIPVVCIRYSGLYHTGTRYTDRACVRYVKTAMRHNIVMKRVR